MNVFQAAEAFDSNLTVTHGDVERVASAIADGDDKRWALLDWTERDEYLTRAKSAVHALGIVVDSRVGAF